MHKAGYSAKQLRFPRASAEPLRRYAPAGSRLSRFPAGVSAVLLHIEAVHLKLVDTNRSQKTEKKKSTDKVTQKYKRRQTKTQLPQKLGLCLIPWGQSM